MPASNPAPLTDRQRKGIFAGVALIAFGIIGALISYSTDSNSLDIFRMIDASQNAMLHAAIWSAVGAGLIFWYLIGPGSAPQKRSDDDEDRRDRSK